MRSRPSRAVARLAVAAALLLPTPGCSSAMSEREERPETSIAFVNQSTQQASVYAFGTSGEPHRVGTVFPGRTEVLRLPWSVVSTGTVHFVVRPLASRRLAVSGPVSIRPGDTFTVTMPPAQNTLNVLPGLPQGR